MKTKGTKKISPSDLKKLGEDSTKVVASIKC